MPARSAEIQQATSPSGSGDRGTGLDSQGREKLHYLNPVLLNEIADR
jgi:hypothetical protein